MWTYLWAFIAFIFGVCTFFLYVGQEDYKDKYKSYHDLYNSLDKQKLLNEAKKLGNERVEILKRLLSVLRSPHPERAIIYSVKGLEVYDAGPWVFRDYDIYGDGRILIEGQDSIVRPKDMEHLRCFIKGNTDLYWLHIELYNDLVKNRTKSNCIKSNKTSNVLRSVFSSSLQEQEYQKYAEYCTWLCEQSYYREFDAWLYHFLNSKGFSRDQWLAILVMHCKQGRYTEAKRLLSDAYKLFQSNFKFKGV